jgi:hypothetical protein
MNLASVRHGGSVEGFWMLGMVALLMLGMIIVYLLEYLHLDVD